MIYIYFKNFEYSKAHMYTYLKKKIHLKKGHLSLLLAIIFIIGIPNKY